jgi:hypothetical protein
VAPALLLIPVILFWRPYFFYMIDDWTALINMVQYPFREYLVQADGEQWFPFFYLVFYPLVKIAGERYYLLVLVNCLGTGVISFLLYLFMKRHLPPGVSLILSLGYSVAAVHHAVAWNAFYLCYLLSLGFFLGALLLTGSYLKRPSGALLAGIGLCALLSILSHNYTLTGLLALPLYVLLVGEKPGRLFWGVLWAVAGAYLIFAWGYLSFPGLQAATSHNRQVFAGLPGPGYFAHILVGAFVAPFSYLFWGHNHFPFWAYGAGVLLFLACLAVIRRWGDSRERRWGLWLLLLNALPFVLVSLTRYSKAIDQAYVARYGVFTVIGALLLTGTAWNILSARFSWSMRREGLAAFCLLGLMFAGQMAGLHKWREKYREISRESETCYRELSRDPPGIISPESFRKFCPGAYSSLTASQVQAIHRFLSGLGGK